MSTESGGKAAQFLTTTLLAILLGACTVPAQTPAAAADPPDDAATQISSPLGSYLAGRHAQQQHDYGAAAKYFGQALAQDPGDYELLNKTFLFELSEGRLDAAKELAARINRIDATAPLPNLVLVLERMKSGDLAGADAGAQNLPHDGIHRFVTPLVQAWTKVGVRQQAAA